ncbi:MAG: BamA/TamA family outer membrane protein, partial [Gemmatimonadota bacterium]|nr:BamA/TamA family outer membrane protein [Gemmatimonadota bacterium]
MTGVADTHPKQGRLFARAALLVGVNILAASPATAGAQRNPCTRLHPMVDAVTFRGIKQLPASLIAPIPVTERTGIFRRWFGWKIGPLTCLDSADVVEDATNIESDYRDRGFIAARVTGRVERHGDRRARVIFDIREGTPVAIATVTVTGLPAAVADSGALIRRLVGQPLDDSVVNAVADSVQALLRDNGHARARPRVVQISGDSATRRGTVRMTFAPGPLTYIGSVSIQVKASGASPAVSEQAVRAAFAIRPGEPFSARRISDGQREIAALELFSQVRVDTAAATGATGAARDTIAMAVSLVEGARRRARTTAGWGTLDCFRTQGRFVEQDFLGLGHRLELNGRVSKIGLGGNVSGLEPLCASRVRNDPFSQQLNYYTGATLRLRGLPTIGGARWLPDLTLFSERRSAVGAYEQTTELGALATSTHTIAQQVSASVQYAYTDSRTRADRAVSCTRFGFCRLEDVASFVLRSPMHTFTTSFARNPLLPTDDPMRGLRWSVDAKYGHASIGKLLPIDFGRVVAEVASYGTLGPWFTAAARVQIGAVMAPADRSFLLPPSERFYGGGQNSVRGYGQNLLGPGSFIVNTIDSIAGPAGVDVGVAR